MTCVVPDRVRHDNKQLICLFSLYSICIGMLMMMSMSGAMNKVLSNRKHKNGTTTKSSTFLSTAAVAGAYQWVRDVYST